jgi:hypothetical protein
MALYTNKSLYFLYLFNMLLSQALAQLSPQQRDSLNTISA